MSCTEYSIQTPLKVTHSILDWTICITQSAQLAWRKYKESIWLAQLMILELECDHMKRLIEWKSRWVIELLKNLQSWRCALQHLITELFFLEEFLDYINSEDQAGQMNASLFLLFRWNIAEYSDMVVELCTPEQRYAARPASDWTIDGNACQVVQWHVLSIDYDGLSSASLGRLFAGT